MIRTDEHPARASAEHCSFCGRARRGTGARGEPIGCKVLVQSETARAIAICPDCVRTAAAILEGR